jgi:hypothetical protein
MKASQEENTHGMKQRRRFLELASGGLLYINMPRNTIKLAMYAKDLGSLPKEMRCL